MMIVSALALLMFQSSLPPQESAKGNGGWLCWSNSGKGSGAIEIRAPRPLTYFTKNLTEFDSEIKSRVIHDHELRNIRAGVTREGTFAGHDVVDVIFGSSDNYAPFGKMVLLGDHGRFRPLVWVFYGSGVEFTPSKIVTVDGTRILVSRHRVDGTGNFLH